jgi:hypothetical protein
MLFATRFLVLLLLLVATSSFAESSFHNALSLQGFTGILNTPTAETTEEGTIYGAYSNQKESKWRDMARKQDNYLLSVGLFDILELGGRLFEAPRVGRDLSGNIKLRVPFIPRGGYLPQLAFGIQDLGGATRTRFLETRYAVATEELWRFRLSLGYGLGPDRMKGVFGGVELKACDWLYLLADDDTRERNVGVRLVTPALFGYPVHLQATAKSSIDHRPGHPEFELGLQVPLGLPHDYRGPMPAPTVAAPPALVEKGADQAATAQAKAGKIPSPPLPEPDAPSEQREAGVREGKSLERLLQRLLADGFQNVRVGSRETLLVVEYENARYNHNELDAIGVVTGIIQQEAPPAFQRLRLVERKKGIGMLRLEMPLQQLREFFRDAQHLAPLQDALLISSDTGEPDGISFIQGEENSSYLTASLMLYPGLTTYLGTEVGVFDYLLSLKPDLYLNLWKGALLDARADLPISWSENYEDGKRFRGERKGAQLERLMLVQAVKPAPTVLAVASAGLVLAERYGTLNELLWTPGEGSHQFRVSQLYASDGRGGNKKEQYLGSYRYYFAPLDLYLQGTGGKFLTQDRGGTLELKRFFGDTSVTVFFKDSFLTDGRNVKAGGIQFDLPLTPRQDMKPRLVQLRGSDDWSYAQQTVIATPKGYNLVSTPTGVRLEPPFNGDRLFYNRDRLSEPYLREHLLRLREAYLRYVLSK